MHAFFPPVFTANPRPRRLLLAALLTALAAAPGLLPSSAAAQCASTDADCRAAQPPVVWLAPGDTTWTGTTPTAQLTVTIHWCGPYSQLDPASRAIWLDGDSVTGSFSAPVLGGAQQVGTQHCVQHGTSVGTLTLSSRQHQLSASIARVDDATSTGQATALYTYGYQPAPSYQVSVSPHAGPAVQRAAGAAATETFQVTNDGNVPATFALTATCTGSAAVGCAPSLPSVTVAAKATASVGVSYHAAGGVGLTGLVGLRAASAQAADSGKVSVATVGAGTSGLVGAIQANGTLRSDCLTVSAGEGAAYECGDLRLVHTFPGVRVMNRGFAPTLVYNSQQARPYPVVQHSYSPPAGATPTTIAFALCTGSPALCHTSSTFPGWAPGESRRIGVAWDAAAVATGVYPYAVVITSTYADGHTATTSITGKMAVVNRSGIPAVNRWGAGWSLAGVEQLYPQSDGSFLWVGGDGSTQIYGKVDAATWAAQPYARPDTLRLVGGEYVRTLPGRAEVRFDGNGHHVRTVNRLGHQTTLAWTGDQLASITLPHGLAYAFEYAGCGGVLSHITAPGSRNAYVVNDCSGRITSIHDPALQPVWFGYGDATARVGSRTDRRGYRTDFRYDAASRLQASKRWMNTAATGDSIVVRFRAQESQSLLATGGSVADAQLYTRVDGPRQDVGDTTLFVLDRWGAPAKVTDALGHVTTLFREDTRWPGLITRVHYPNGREVTATYDARGHLAASVDWSNPRAGSYATMLYEWDAYWDAPTKVTQPEGELTLTAYDAYGRTAWIQPGPDSARRTTFAYHPAADANAPGLVQSVKSALTLAETYAYDAQGNLSVATSPDGLQTRTFSSTVGRVDSIIAPRGARKRLTYDGADQVVEEESYGPSRLARSSFEADSTYSAEHVWVHTYRNANGQPDSVARWQSPDPAAIGRIVTGWRYDGAGRSTVEIAPDSTPATLADNPRDSTVYDPAGNPTDVFTRRGFHISMRYDSLSRLTRRITPAASVSIAGTTVTSMLPVTTYFPYFGQDAAGNFTAGPVSQMRAVTIPADTATFGYDGMGNMLWANNRDARVARSWNPDGTLASETQRIRTYAGTDTVSHAYRLDFEYDLDGRRTALIHPGNISPSAPERDTTRYGYDPVTGALATVAGRAGYAFEYDVAGRTTRLSRGATHETFGFDAAGRMYERHEWSGGTELHRDLTSFDPATGDVTQVSTSRETVLQGRRGLGALGWVDTYNTFKGTRNVEYYQTDPLANQVYTRMDAYGTTDVAPALHDNEAVVHGYQPGTGRLVSTANVNSAGPYEVSVYDAAGNQYFRAGIRVVTTPYTIGTTSNAHAKLRDETAMYYGADDRLRVADRRTCLYFDQTDTTAVCDLTRVPAYENRSAFEEYRYDALGRRVLVRTRSEFACTQFCLNTLRRTVWDGDKVLYEISAPGGSGASAAQMEADTGLAAPLFTGNNGTGVNVFFPYGRILYEHGSGLDAPLGVVRMEYSDTLHGPQVILPHANWRGSYDRGTTLGYCYVYGSNGSAVLPPPDSTPSGGDRIRPVGGTWGGSAEHCINVDWPAAYTWSALQYRRGYSGPVSWMGSLIYESRDASGLYYRRNRYYDSEKGRFTQQDPIGLAGGVNVYGFAAGDPISYGDPYGLSCKDKRGKVIPCPPSRGTAGEVSRNGGGRVQGPGSATVTFGGLAAVAAYTIGYTVAGGVYMDSHGIGVYGKYGAAPGVDIAAGVEGGNSASLSSFSGASVGMCGGTFIASGCVTKNEAGTTGSGSVSIGPTEVTPVSFHAEISNTVVSRYLVRFPDSSRVVTVPPYAAQQDGTSWVRKQ
ncbi:MAG TPA: RHS repeat-associated core domain-containing protein [Longimicrobium sp.]|jgi:RHS repeat-associated protein|nr:RHS repeat-associated core domain-containing protein [Longimicrobium sp.]